MKVGQRVKIRIVGYSFKGIVKKIGCSFVQIEIEPKNVSIFSILHCIWEEEQQESSNYRINLLNADRTDMASDWFLRYYTRGGKGNVYSIQTKRAIPDYLYYTGNIADINKSRYIVVKEDDDERKNL